MLVFGTVWSTTNRGGNFVLNDVDRNSASLLLRYIYVDACVNHRLRCTLIFLRGAVAQNKWPIKFAFIIVQCLLAWLDLLLQIWIFLYSVFFLPQKVRITSFSPCKCYFETTRFLNSVNDGNALLFLVKYFSRTNLTIEILKTSYPSTL